MRSQPSSEVDQYIADFPETVQDRLQEMQRTIQQAAPEAEEKINYGIPTFVLHGNLVHYGGYQKHIGFYPGPSALKAYQAELAGYQGGKGSVQFPLDQPLPLALIAEMVAFRVKENVQKNVQKKKKTGGGFLPELAVPAQRALKKQGITTQEQLATYSAVELLALHGLGKSSIPKIELALKEKGLSLKS